MRKRIITPIAISLMMAAACTNINTPPIPEERFAHTLFEMHRADAILNQLNLKDDNLENDSLSYYNYVFAKEGISRKEFLETIEWYTQHPEQYSDLYNKVTKLVSKYEQDEKARYEISGTREPNDVWDMKSDWNLPLDGDRNPIAFNIAISKTGIYTLSADVTYYEDDGSVEPHTSIIVEYDDGSTSENVIYEAIKDGKEHHIEVMVTAEKGKKPKNIRGWVLDHSNNTTRKHIDCYNIKLKHSDE